MLLKPLNPQKSTRSKVTLALWLILAAFSLSVAQLSAQSGQVILPSREVSVRGALGEIEKQTEYSVAVNWENLDGGKKVMFPASALPVNELLDKTLAGSNCRWEIIGKQIAIVYYTSSPDATPVLSATNRPRSSQQMKVVHDPWSVKQISPEDISKVLNDYWSSDGRSQDSLGLAVINFRVNSSVIERDYMNNAEVLDMIHRTFSDNHLYDDMEFITVTAAASPEGNTAINERLAADRAMAIKTYIMWKYPFMDRHKIFTFSIGEDWEGLRKLVSDNIDTPYRHDLLAILDSYYDSDIKRYLLKQLGNGEAYRHIPRDMLPKLRGAAACMIYYKSDPKSATPKEIVTRVDTVYVDRVVEKIVEVPLLLEQPTRRSMLDLAIKTNLLHDVAMLPDLGVEVPLGKRWSLEIQGQWSWWKFGKHNYHRIQMVGLEGRKWLGDERQPALTGHFLGVYAYRGTFDLRFGDTGYLSDRSYSAGISYGYSMAISDRLNMEFSLGLGYLGGRYKRYLFDGNSDLYLRQSNHRLNFFGPTKARIALVWMMGRGSNDKKASIYE